MASTADVGVSRENRVLQPYFQTISRAPPSVISEAEEIAFEGKFIANRKPRTLPTTFWNLPVPPCEPPGATSRPALLTTLAKEKRQRAGHAVPTGEKPWEWKNQNNQAGSTLFVSHDFVQGTLREGFERFARWRIPSPAH